MAKWVATVYDTLADAETGIETIDDDKEIAIGAFKDGMHQKVLVAEGNPYTASDLVVYQGITDASGNVGGTTLVCSDISANADWDGNLVIITSGDYQGQARDISGATTSGTITVGTAFDGQILDETTFSIAGIRTVPIEVIKFAAAGSKTIASGATKYLSIDSGTNGAEIISITVKGVVGADWTIETYIPVDDAVAAPAAGDKRDEDTYLNGEDKGGQLTNLGAIRYNMFLDITNDSGGSDNIDEVIVAYRSAGTLSLAWEA